MEIRGKVAVVTGAATGIGRASALALAGEGASVVVADIDVAGGEETVRLVTKLGVESSFVTTDVSDPAQVVRLLDEATREHGGVDIIHNNAGIMSGNPPWPGTSLERIGRVVSVNVLGVMYGTKVGIDVLAERGGGAIVNTASLVGQAALPPDAVYAATKAAIISFTRSCAMLKESHNIRVNAVLPGLVDTSMILKTGDGVQPADWLAPRLDGHAALKPADVAAAVVQLIRDDTTGETLEIATPSPER